MNKREECLRRANEIVNGQREQQYGNPEDNFQMIADLWSAYLRADVSPVDVAMMMGLLEIARISTGIFKEDSFVDLAGYAACGYEIARGGKVTVDDIEDDLLKAVLSEYAPIEELARHMGARD